MERPPLDRKISTKDFIEFYWHKEELVCFCKEVGINPAGSKIELSQRITHFLSTGNIPVVSKPKTSNPKSTFNWNKQNHTRSTLITDNYKNTENVRAFFTKEIGSHFSFNVQFMNWMKENIGRSLNDAIREWKRIHELKKKAKITKRK